MNADSQFGFDDDGARVPIAWDGDGEPDALEPQEGRADALRAFLFYVTEGRFDAESFGRKIALIAFLAGCFPSMTQAELAEKLELSPGRISQLVKLAKRSKP